MTTPHAKLHDFTAEQIRKFEAMHKALRDYNARLRRQASPIAPAFTDDEMSLYSTYRQLLVASQCNLHT